MKKLNLLASSIKTALLIGAVSSVNVYAAEETAVEKTITAQTQAEQTTIVEEIEEEVAEERITVTGSRIRKAEFSNASPIQVISGEISREMGMFNAGEMLQQTNQASGVQIDNTFGGYVLDNGPGAATIGFRGLGAERTLVLINGRRMAPAGVGGAPTSPDLNLIPGVMIERVENLLDGASTVYGSDAVAGVVNVLLKKDVEGFNFEGSYRQPKGDGGETTVLSGMWGTTFDNGFFTAGVEYNEQKAQSRAGNPFAQGCDERIFEDESGTQYKRYGGIGPTIGGEKSCDIYPLTNRVFIPLLFGSVYYTPGYTNTGIPNLSETTTTYPGLPGYTEADFNGDGIPDGHIVDGNGDGLLDVDFQDPMYAFQQSDYYKSGDYRSQNKRISLMFNGEYNFEDDNDSVFYYEGLYAQRKSPIFNPGAQLFPTVSSANPYNPCNPSGLNGVDCVGVTPYGNYGPLDVDPIINIRGDRDQHEIEVSQYRLVSGITGNLNALENVGMGSWYYDVYASYSASKGDHSVYGVGSVQLANSLDAVINADGSVSCSDTSDGCVPVNLFSDNIFQEGGGTLTAAEANYLFVDRKMSTEVSQLVVNGYIGGDFFQLPWNENIVAGIVGAEFRRDEIKSDPNDVASQGLLYGYYSDKGADGSRNLKEIFTEVELPLLDGIPGVEELTITASGRWSEESFYDPATTYSLKGVYRPFEWLTIRGTQGTSYRAPNLRERFLNGTTGFQNVFDPCVVPNDARISDPNDLLAKPGYDSTLDLRDTSVLEACRSAGLDPTSLGLGTSGSDESFTATGSTEINTGGSLELKEERSLAKTFGFVFEQPIFEEFDLTVSLTRFNIEVTNSIAEPSYLYSVGQCYSSEGNKAFCSRISRNSAGQIDLVDESFINIGLLTTKGFDYNIYYNQDFVVNDRTLGVSLDLQATRQTESLYDVLGTVDDNAGEISNPEWRGTARLNLSYDDFRFSWTTNYIGGGELDDQGEFEEGTVGCGGLTDSAGDAILCRPVGYSTSYKYHNMSFSWVSDDYSVTAGVRNVFNHEPPKVDSSVFSNNNIPLGVAYDTNGRTPYINFRASF